MEADIQGMDFHPRFFPIAVLDVAVESVKAHVACISLIFQPASYLYNIFIGHGFCHLCSKLSAMYSMKAFMAASAAYHSSGSPVAGQMWCFLYSLFGVFILQTV